MLTWLLPAAGRAAVMLRITFPSGSLQEKGLRDWGRSRRGLLNYKPSIFTLLSIKGNKWCWWGTGEQFGVSEHLPSSSMLEIAIAKQLMGGDDTICRQIRVCIFMQAVRGGRRSPCAGNVMLLEETCFLTTLAGLFIAVLFLALTKGFHMDGVFSWLSFSFFFSLSWRGRDGGRTRPWQYLL